MGAMDSFMAAGGPAGTAGEKRGMIPTTDEDYARGRLLLEVALQAEVLILRLQHLGIDRAVGAMACDATFAGTFVLEDIWRTLLHMALHASVVHAAQAAHSLHDSVTLVEVMAVAATHLA